MLNRRILRVKAMQALYAYHQAKAAGFYVALDDLKESFNPDLNSMDIQPDSREVSLNKNLADKYFNKLWNKKRLTFDSDVPEEVTKIVADQIDSFQTGLKKDQKHYKSVMLKEVEKIYDRFIKVLILPLEFSKMATQERERSNKRNAKTVEKTGLYNLADNRLLQDFKNDSRLEAASVKAEANWSGDQDNIKSWYRKVLKEDETYQGYLSKNSPSAQDDVEIVNHIYRQIIFKHEEIEQFLELWDINWFEDKEIIKGLIKKTIKSYDPDTENKFQLLELSINWDEDRQYFEDLYDHTIANADEYDKVIAQKSTNWEIERISMMDKIIIEMALAEMINFPSIPVKVSINEYIELSKNYSTPKSKQFVNGVLDALAAELQEKGKIRKSGRGLIDNK